MKITDIAAQKKRERFNIFLDGEFAFGVSAELRFTKKLEVGQNLTQKEIESVVEADQIERLFNKALKFLSYRPRSEREIRDYLLRKGKLRDVEKSAAEKSQYEGSIERIIKKLKSIGQIDDMEFAKWWVEQRGKFRPRGQRLVKLELLQKGVDKEIIEEVTDSEEGKEGLERVGEEELAFKVASKKLLNYKNLSKEEFRMKMGQYLARRGFSWDVIKKVVDSLIGKRVE